MMEDGTGLNSAECVYFIT